MVITVFNDSKYDGRISIASRNLSHQRGHPLRKDGAHAFFEEHTFCMLDSRARAFVRSGLSPSRVSTSGPGNIEPTLTGRVVEASREN